MYLHKSSCIICMSSGGQDSMCVDREQSQANRVTTVSGYLPFMHEEILYSLLILKICSTYTCAASFFFFPFDFSPLNCAILCVIWLW